MKFHVLRHWGKTDGTPGAVVAGPEGVVVETDGAAVGLPSHLVQTVEVTVVRMVEVVIPISVDVIPAVV